MSLPPGYVPLPQTQSALRRLAMTLITALLAAFVSGFGVRLGWEMAERALR